jgi:hypothetical protein
MPPIISIGALTPMRCMLLNNRWTLYVSDVSLEISDGTEILSTWAQLRLDAFMKRSRLMTLIASRDTLADMRLPIVLPIMAATAHRNMPVPHRKIRNIRPDGTTLSIICARIIGNIRSMSVPVTFMLIPTAILPMNGPRYRSTVRKELPALLMYSI